jgi:hypothetical protein
MRWIVSGHLGGYKQGQSLTTKEEIGKYTRLWLSEGHEFNITPEMLSDDAIEKIIKHHHPDGCLNSDSFDDVSDFEAAMESDLRDAVKETA